MTIMKFIFNSFMVNTWLLHDDTGECLIVDPACYSPREKEQLKNYIASNNLTPVRCLNTHCHIDHVLGNEFIGETYGLWSEFHPASAGMLMTVREIGTSFGFKINTIPEPDHYLADGETIRWGNSSLKVLYTPGHAEGSVCLYCEEEGFVITGDVLFRDTVGRTDLPTGDFNKLMNSITTRLFTLPDQTVVYPGHGPETEIGYEKRNNPFIR